jgi:hypothetical protein
MAFPGDSRFRASSTGVGAAGAGSGSGAEAVRRVGGARGRLDAITPRYRVAVALGAGLGLREGETFGLTVPRVDFLRRKVHVLSQAQRGQLGADLKTEASTRTVPADEWVLNEISTHV